MPLSALASNPPSTPVLASNPPLIPVLVYGSVKIDGALAPVGTKVTASFGGKEIETFILTEAGKYSMNISKDEIAIGETIKFSIGTKTVSDTESKFKMVDVDTVSNVNYNLEIKNQSNSGGNGGSSGGGSGSGSGNSATPAVPATPADPESGTPATPATPATDQYGKVKDATSVNIIDGDIIQCKNSANPFAVYIVKEINGKKYIRHIVSLEIFNYYKHLRWENLVQVDSLDGFLLSGWVRVNTGANGNPGSNDKVYEINGDQTRHWIDMTAEEFLQHGGSEEAIYSVNAGELGLYKNGAAVRLQ